MVRQILIAVIVFAIVGCGYRPGGGEPKYFSTANAPIEFKFPSDWYLNNEKNPYDLQCLSKDQSFNTGVFLFTKADLANRKGARELLEGQIEDLRSKRSNFQILEPMQTVTLNDKTLTTVSYTGEKEASKYNYRFTLIEFIEQPDYYPVVIQVALPEKWLVGKAILEDITKSARVK